MRRHLIAWRGLWLGALAFAGVVVTHAVSYPLAIPDHAARHEVLHQTGHGLWPPIIGGLALAALVAGLAGLLTGTTSVRPASVVRAVAPRLALLQGAGWLTVEAVERVAAGDPRPSLRSLVPVAVGLGVQIAVAIVGALVLSLLRLAATLLRGSNHLAPRPRPRLVAFPVVVPRALVLATAWSPRGPPLA